MNGMSILSKIPEFTSKFMVVSGVTVKGTKVLPPQNFAFWDINFKLIFKKQKMHKELLTPSLSNQRDSDGKARSRKGNLAYSPYTIREAGSRHWPSS